VKLRHIILSLVFFVVILLVVVLPIVTNTTSSAPMLDMPLILTRNGKPLPPEEIQSLQYEFREAPTSFEPTVQPGKMKDAQPFQNIGFRLAAPFSITRYGMFGKKTIKPEYHSLHLQLTLVDGTALNLNFPVISDTALKTPIQIELNPPKK